MRKGTDFLLRLRPWSPEAFAVALLATIAASIVQEAMASFGVCAALRDLLRGDHRSKSSGGRSGGLLCCRDRHS